MYPCSGAFHEAVKNGNEQKALLIFSDCVFTDDDIRVDTGIEFHDYFNTEADLCIGQTLSNEISFTLFNDDRLLNNYEFGDFLATIGVKVGEEVYQQYGNVMVITQQATYIGGAVYPYIMRNNTILQSQPGFPVESILAYDGNVWCFNSDGQYAVYNDETGEDITNQFTLIPFMQKKVAEWRGKGIFYDKTDRILFVNQEGTRRRYEFVPLGYFTAERPNVPDVIEIRLTCYDFMQRFERDMPSANEGTVTFPTSIGGLFVQLCDIADVPYQTDTFINSTAVINERPEEFDNATMRDVLKWIAEAACSNARFNRDGLLVLDWIRETEQEVDEHGYAEFHPYWYATGRVTKLHNRASNGDFENTAGAGTEAYLIQDNPLLKGVKADG